ncbi:peptide chain release factor N(5)-glutamine methyltransferase [Pseudodesulfovibrio sp. F-1]|uniref:Release factor glutamine methyltransferase n=1 Tax=Pseudodesulfovibrio alkaliphilus TaxID=2661613 RepID=A0A7K1KLU4_9BACT|nr:peptide chain release factor N(5)-glutamine methyltransferase [Pseudodesulfovibrio alkaliphilus]MUM77053.1 peptide chain release factor N(5)-glutamine methyltransferase [Pseudodesulfovibrio alkaliphilus]
MGLTVQAIVRECATRLADVDSPLLSAQLLVGEVLGLSPLALSLERDMVLDTVQAGKIHDLTERRAAGEPVAYLLGRREFYGVDFAVTPDVLIPRPETEHLVEAALAHFPVEASLRFADLGTGSGILAVTLARLYPLAVGFALDRSGPALDVARRNARAHGVDQRIAFVQGDFTESVPCHGCDLIVANPPYVTEAEYAKASREVAAYEPREALISGPDGLDHVRGLLPKARNALRQGGVLILEIGCSQAEGVKFIMSSECPGFKDFVVTKDLAGHDRVVFMRRA